MGVVYNPFKDKETFYACQEKIFSNDIKGVRYYIEEVGLELGCDGGALAKSCIYADGLDILKYLIAKDVDGLFDQYKLTLLACEHGCLDIVDFFNTIGVDINQQEVMVAAIIGGNDRLVKYLCDKKISFTYDDDLLTPLLVSDNIDVLKLLYKNNQDIGFLMDRLADNIKNDICLKIRAYVLVFKEKELMNSDNNKKLFKIEKRLNI